MTFDDNKGLVTITLEEYNYLQKRDLQLEFALDMRAIHPNCNLDELIEQMEEE